MVKLDKIQPDGTVSISPIFEEFWRFMTTSAIITKTIEKSTERYHLNLLI